MKPRSQEEKYIYYGETVYRHEMLQGPQAGTDF